MHLTLEKMSFSPLNSVLRLKFSKNNMDHVRPDLRYCENLFILKNVVKIIFLSPHRF